MGASSVRGGFAVGLVARFAFAAGFAAGLRRAALALARAGFFFARFGAAEPALTVRFATFLFFFATGALVFFEAFFLAGMRGSVPYTSVRRAVRCAPSFYRLDRCAKRHDASSG